MRVEIKLDDDSTLTLHQAARIFERDGQSLYVYGKDNGVLAILPKAQVVRLVTAPDAGDVAVPAPRPA